MQGDITIVVATHKMSPMPEDSMYLPLHVGAAGKFDSDGKPLDFGYIKDDTGDNISSLNPNFGTQTGLYWAWKNLNSEFKGLVHYRRFFVGMHTNKADMLSSVISYDEMKPFLLTYKVFVPTKRRYYIESLYSHYAHTHDVAHLDFIRDRIKSKFPDYLSAFDKVMRRKWGYMFNMMVLRKDLMDDYCTWLFELLFSLYENVDQSEMTAFEKRFCGRVSELLFNVWLEYELEKSYLENKDIKELHIIEDVRWVKKVISFLTAKFFGKKYCASALVKNSHRVGQFYEK